MSTYQDCTGYDLAAGQATGMRLWAVDQLGRLTGVAHRQVWTPGENVARCARTRRSEACARGECGHYHGPALSLAGIDTGQCAEPDPCGGDDPDCGCGFYAYHDGVSVFGGPAVSGVLGVVEGYGRTTVGTKGFRAQKARIVALALPKDRRHRPPTRKTKAAVGWCALAAGSVASLGVNIHDLATAPTVSWSVVAPLVVNIVAIVFALFLARERFWPVAPWCRYKAIHRYPQTCDCRPPGALVHVQPPEVEERIRRNYPDVAVYDSVEAMKAAHPVDPMLEPTPENDPQFWTRSVDDGGYAARGHLLAGQIQAGSINVNTTPFQQQMRALTRAAERVRRMSR